MTAYRTEIENAIKEGILDRVDHQAILQLVDANMPQAGIEPILFASATSPNSLGGYVDVVLLTNKRLVAVDSQINVRTLPLVKVQQIVIDNGRVDVWHGPRDVDRWMMFLPPKSYHVTFEKRLREAVAIAKLAG